MQICVLVVLPYGVQSWLLFLRLHQLAIWQEEVTQIQWQNCFDIIVSSISFGRILLLRLSASKVQLRWQLTTINWHWNQHWIKPFQTILPTKEKDICLHRRHDSKRRMVTAQESQTTRNANNQCSSSAGISHCAIHRPMEKCTNSNCIWRLLE